MDEEKKRMLADEILQKFSVRYLKAQKELYLLIREILKDLFIRRLKMLIISC